MVILENFRNTYFENVWKSLRLGKLFNNLDETATYPDEEDRK